MKHCRFAHNLYRYIHKLALALTFLFLLITLASSSSALGQSKGTNLSLTSTTTTVECKETRYRSEVASFVRFRHNEASTDEAVLLFDVKRPFCKALKAGPEAVIIKLDCCNTITIPGRSLIWNARETKCRAESPTYKLKFDCRTRGGICRKNHLNFSLKLKNVDLDEQCFSNPILTCVSITDGPCICAEAEFEEVLDRRDRIKKYILIEGGNNKIPNRNEEPACLCECPVDSPSGCISGSVLTYLTGEPVAGKTVLLKTFLRKSKKKFVKRVVTDENGCYGFYNLPKGRYTVWAKGRCKAVGGKGRRHYVKINRNGKVNDVNYDCR